MHSASTEIGSEWAYNSLPNSTKTCPKSAQSGQAYFGIDQHRSGLDHATKVGPIPEIDQHRLNLATTKADPSPTRSGPISAQAQATWTSVWVGGAIIVSERLSSIEHRGVRLRRELVRGLPDGRAGGQSDGREVGRSVGRSAGQWVRRAVGRPVGSSGGRSILQEGASEAPALEASWSRFWSIFRTSRTCRCPSDPPRSTYLGLCRAPSQLPTPRARFLQRPPRQ